MASWLAARQYLHACIGRLPRVAHRGLLELNRGRGRVYGRAYARYRGYLADNERHFDNVPSLLEVVNRAGHEVAFYRELYGGGRVQSLAEFEALPFIDKDTVRANFTHLISDSIDRAQYDECTPGGTSGRPLAFLAPKSRYVVELATMHSLWARAGYDHEPRAVLRNRRLGTAGQHVIDPVTREIVFDGFRLGDADLEHVYSTIVRLGIRFVHAYPSSAVELARFITRRGLGPGPIVAFLCGSEAVSAAQIELIRERLGVRFYSWYGHSEKLVLAGYCRGSDDYHVESTYGYCELVDELGRVVREPGAIGEIVGTSLHNPGMPLIRYRTGDLAEYAGDSCPHCGRRVMLLRNVQGRWRGERVYRADGSFITTTALNRHDDVYRFIDGLQYVQQRRGELLLRIVRGERYTRDHEARILDHLRDRLGPGSRVAVEYVDQLVRGTNGKVPFLVSTLGDPP
jgi:phenylacetate-CoA ligase